MKVMEVRLEPNGALLTGFCYGESVTLPESSAKPAVLIIPGALATHATGDQNRDVAKWFEMSVRFLEHVWSGRNLLWGELAQGPLNIDSRNDILVHDSSTRTVLEKHIPDQVPLMTSNPFFSYISFRRFAFLTKIPQETVTTIEWEINAI